MIQMNNIIKDIEELDKYINQLEIEKKKLEEENLKKRQLIEKLKSIIEQNK